MDPAARIGQTPRQKRSKFRFKSFQLANLPTGEPYRSCLVRVDPRGSNNISGLPESCACEKGSLVRRFPLFFLQHTRFASSCRSLFDSLQSSGLGKSVHGVVDASFGLATERNIMYCRASLSWLVVLMVAWHIEGAPGTSTHILCACKIDSRAS